jgi:receptor protein-tyrosine kinase
MPDDPPHVIVVTSSMPNEGKSTAAINIALALAEAEQNVALVDGNLRRPRLDKYLHLVASSGFSTVLAGRASLNEVLQQTEFERLALLTSGPVPPNPSELLGSQAATKVFNDLRAQFDYVIVDSSPLVVTDAAVLAADADGVLVVAQYGQTKRDQLAHAIRNLQDVAAPILGAIFTKAPTRGSKSYSDSYEGDGSTPSNVRSTKRERQRSRNPLRSRGGRHTPNSTRDAHKF